MPKKHGGSRFHIHVRPENPAVMLAATLIVALGVVGVAVLSSRISGKPMVGMGAASDTAMGQMEPPKAASVETLILLNADAATVVHLDDGRVERMTKSQLDARWTSATKPREGSMAANASVVAYPDASLLKGFVASSDGEQSAHLADPRADGATAILIRSKSGDQRTVVLREGERPLRDGALAGWFDAQTMAIVAYTEATKAVYAARLDGSLTKLVTLPDNVIGSTVRAGDFWYMTGTDSGGIELPPGGPSDLHRVGSNGKDVVIAHDQDHVITGVVADAAGRMAFLTDDGHASLIGSDLPNGQVDVGNRRPVAFLSDGRVILRDGFALSIFTPSTGRSTRLTDLPEGDVQVFIANL